MDLTEDDVLEILNLIDKSSFDFLKLEVGDLKLTVSKGEYVPDASDNKPAPMKQVEVSAPENPAPSPEKTAEQPEQKQRVPRHFCRQAFTVHFRNRSYSLQAQGATGLDDAYGYLAAIGDDHPGNAHLLFPLLFEDPLGFTRKRLCRYSTN